MPYGETPNPLVPVGYESYVRAGFYAVANTGDGGTGRSFFNLREACSQVVFVYGNFSPGGLGGETSYTNPGPVTWQAQLDDPTQANNAIPAPQYPLTVQGATTVIQQPYTVLQTDPIDYDFTPATTQTIAVRTDARGNAGTNLPLNQYLPLNWNGWPTAFNNYGFNTSDFSNYGNAYGVAATNNLQTSGYAWVTNHTYAGAFGPIMMLGVRNSRIVTPVVGFMGDSNGAGFGDSNSGGLGYLARAFRAANIPFINLSVASEGLATLGVAQVRYKNRRTLLNYCSHVVIQNAVNDIFTGGTSLANLKLYLQASAIAARGRGAIPVALTCTPNPNNNGFTTSQAQVLGANEPTRVLYNDYLRSWAPNTIDPILSLLGGVIDVCATNIGYEVNSSNIPTIDGGRVYCGPLNNTPYSSDGLHANALGCALLQNAVQPSRFVAGGGVTSIVAGFTYN
jgi:lysophospholipase L1-like esterase